MNKKMKLSSDLVRFSLITAIREYRDTYKALPTILRCGEMSFISAYELKSKGMLEALAIIYGLADVVDGLIIIYDSTFKDDVWSLETEGNSLYNEGA